MISVLVNMQKSVVTAKKSLKDILPPTEDVKPCCRTASAGITACHGQHTVITAGDEHGDDDTDTHGTVAA
jgi:hypothetical protein